MHVSVSSKSFTITNIDHRRNTITMSKSPANKQTEAKVQEADQQMKEGDKL
jgi:hypothetical protein